MIPTLFEIGPIAIHSFGLMLAVAFLTISFLVKKQFKRIGQNPDDGEVLLLVSAVAGLAGSKIYHLIENWSLFLKDPIGMTFSGAGLTFYGGLILATISVLLVARWKKIPLLKLIDIGGPLIMIGYAIGRIGCHLAGDGDYGIPTDLAWGVNYENGVVPPSAAFRGTEWEAGIRAMHNGIIPDDLLVHPTPLYETIVGFGIFFFLWQLTKKNLPDGTVFAGYLVLGGLERLLIEFIRLNETVAFGLSGAQLISVVMILTGAAWLAWLKPGTAEAPPARNKKPHGVKKP